jgi:hypothetical protein
MPFVPIGGVRPAGLALAAMSALVAAGGTAFYYHARESRSAALFADQQTRTIAALNDARGQIHSLSARLDALSVADVPAPVETPRRVSPPHVRTIAQHSGQHRPVVNTTRVEDPRFQQFQSQLSDQQRELTQTREDLQSRMDSTRDELGSSIAKNHEELVLLQKRGERNFHEFTLTKSKDFQTIGPLSLSLRKADTKHRNYNLAMIVADARLEKKHVNLFEPVLISVSDRPQPVELVVNQISKDEIRGYVSEPKYKRSELADNSQAARAKPQQLVVRQ